MDDATPIITSPTRGEQDPSALTTQQIQREVSQTHALLKARLEGVIETLGTRLNGMDKALEIVQEYPTAVDRAISQLRELHEEKFKNIQTLLIERAKQRAQWEQASMDAIDKAFSAAQELLREQRSAADAAISKADTATQKQIDQLGTMHNTTTRAQDYVISDLKERLVGMENRSKGAVALWGLIVGGIGLFGVIVAIFFQIFRNM